MTGLDPIQPNEHVCLAGITGCGKTSLAQRYLIAFQNVVIIDPKWRFKWPGGEVNGKPVPIYHDFATMRKKLGTGRAIFRPPKTFYKPEAIGELYGWALDREETVVVSDETYPLTPRGQITEEHQACLTRGRESGVGIWTCTQRPMLIPNFCISESMHVFMFRLRLEGDRKKMAGVMGPEVIENPPGKHGFWYSHETWPEPLMVPQGIQL